MLLHVFSPEDVLTESVSPSKPPVSLSFSPAPVQGDLPHRQQYVPFTL